MRRRVSKREILRRLERLEALLAQPAPAPLEGQQALDLTGGRDDDREPPTRPSGRPPARSPQH